MKTSRTRFGQHAVIALLLVAAVSVRAQGSLIGPSSRNGSFEDGVAAPWFVDLTVAQNPEFASHGSWYGVVGIAETRPAVAHQNLNSDPSAGLIFSLTFDARVGSPGYTSVSTRMYARSVGGPTSAVTSISTPPISSSEWQSYEYLLEMLTAWDEAGFGFRIEFSKDQPLDGIAHYAYLDNVVLTQVPEPSAVVLLGIAAFVVAGRVFRNW